MLHFAFESQSNFIHGLSFIAKSLDEWPLRPFNNDLNSWTKKPRTYVKEEAPFVVLDGNFIYPVFPNDNFYESAKLCGYTKEEVNEARQRLGLTLL